MPEEKKDQLMKTGQLIKESGVSRQTLYTYLTMGLVKPRQTTSAGHNLFGRDALRRLQLINRLNSSGYTLQEIREIFFRNRG